MSWGTVDADGRQVGYNVRGQCEHPGCGKPLMLGLDAACGGMHGAGNTIDGPDGVSCAGYFCDQHLTLAEGVGARLCFACAAAVETGEPAVLDPVVEVLAGGKVIGHARNFGDDYPIKPRK